MREYAGENKRYYLIVSKGHVRHKIRHFSTSELFNKSIIDMMNERGGHLLYVYCYFTPSCFFKILESPDRIIVQAVLDGRLFLTRIP
jgi:hypothetical protein